jgi:phospholipase D1/2
MEENSGVKFHEAQVALARQWVGDITDNNKNSDVPTTVLISKPQETTEGITISEKTNVQTETLPLPGTETEARQIIERFERGATRSDLHVSDNVVQHMMSDRTPLESEQWEGTEEEELNACVYLRCILGVCMCMCIMLTDGWQQIYLGIGVYPLQVDDCRRQACNRE